MGVNGVVVDGKFYTSKYGHSIPLSDGAMIEFPGVDGNIPALFTVDPF